jgi:serine/threonine protein kinase
MPAPVKTEEFIELTRNSGVIDDKRLDAYLDKLRAEGTLPPEPGRLAALMVQDSLLTKFQAENFLQGRWRRFTLGNYRVLERIGTGGMGSVYLCEHKFMRRRAAVKVLPTAKAADPASLERFYREARAVAALDHPNIVRAYDVDHEDDLHFLVMEYVDGLSLQELVRKDGPLEPAQAANYIGQAARGLQHAHEIAGLVHRDIKPGNVIVDRAGTVKLLDLGLARFFLDEDDLLTKKYDENVLGTADYLAPEQVIDSHEVDIRADIYSLGATFYFCLTGRTPFGEGTTAQKLIWHQTRQVKPVRQVRADVPMAMEAVLQKMLAKDPNQRYQTPLEVQLALGEWIQMSVAAPTDSQIQRANTGEPQGAVSDAKSMLVLPEASLKPTSSIIRKATPTSPQPTPSSKNRMPGKAAPRSPSPAPAKRRPGQSRNDRIAAELAQAAGGRADEEEEGGSYTIKGLAAADEDSLPVEEEQEESTTDTQETRGKADTEPNAPKRKTAKKPAQVRFRPKPPPKSGPSVLVWGGIVGVLGTLGVVAALVFTGRFSGLSGGAKEHARAPTILHVRREPQPGESATLKDALSKAQNGDRIVVSDQINEVVELTGVKDITIEAEPGKHVQWFYPFKRSGNAAGIAVLLVSKAENVHIKGFDMAGRGFVDHVIYATGYCPGLTFEDLHLSGARTSGITFASCAGAGDNRVQCINLQIETRKMEDAGIYFKFERGLSDVTDNENFLIRNCTFNGPEDAACRQEKGASKRVRYISNFIRTSPDQPLIQMPEAY